MEAEEKKFWEESEFFETCKEFWRQWASLHPKEWSNFCKGYPQKEDKLKDGK